MIRDEVVGLISLRVPDKSVQSKRELIQYGVVISAKADEVAVDAPEPKRIDLAPGGGP